MRGPGPAWWIAVGVAVLASATRVDAQACDLIDPDLTDPEVRDVVFEGTLLGHRQVDGAVGSIFLVHRSWKGVTTDTISVLTPIPPYAGVGNVGRPAAAGETYLVFGDLDGSQVVTRSCDAFLWRAARFEDVPVGLYEGRVTVGDSTHAFHLLVSCIVGDARCEVVRAGVRTHPVAPGGPGTRFIDQPQWAPFSEAPRLLNLDEIERHLAAVRPDAELVIEVGSQRQDPLVEFWLLVDETGGVERVHLTRSAANRDVDSVVVESAKAARFSPARNRDRTVPVWLRGYLVDRTARHEVQASVGVALPGSARER